MDSSFTVFAVGIEIALYKVASINVLIQVCQDEFELFFFVKKMFIFSLFLYSLSIFLLLDTGVSFAKWNISEVIVRSLYHANIFTMLVAGPDGLASIR
jgi:hypothetical protein